MAKVKITGHASGTGVVTVTAPNTSTDRVITLPDSTGTILDNTSTLDATKLSGALPALSGASLTGVNAINGGRKNLIINGAMRVAQRATSVTSVSTTAFRTCDRWLPSFNAMGTYTITQEAASGLSGFPTSQKFLCTTAASPSSSNSFRLYYSIEGQDLQSIKKGNADAEAVTLSFWVRSKKTGTGQVNLSDNDNSRNVNKTYAISVADTWEKKTVTFPADTTGSFDNDNASSLSVMFFLDGGTNFTSGTVTETWHSATNANTGAGNTLAISGAINNYFEITGVQLELGSVATDFEHRSYGEELALCHRYYWQPDAGVYYYLMQYNESYKMTQVQLPVTMRVSPSVTYTVNDGSGYGDYNFSPSQISVYKNSAYDSAGSWHLLTLKVDSEL